MPREWKRAWSAAKEEEMNGEWFTVNEKWHKEQGVFDQEMISKESSRFNFGKKKNFEKPGYRLEVAFSCIREYRPRAAEQLRTAGLSPRERAKEEEEEKGGQTTIGAQPEA